MFEVHGATEYIPEVTKDDGNVAGSKCLGIDYAG